MKNYYAYTSYTDQEDKKRLDFIVNTLRKHCPPGGKVLDVGCGNGNISLAVGSLGYQVTGLDISEESVDSASKRNTLQNVQFVCGDAESLADLAEYDAVICSEVLEHLDHPELLVRQLSTSLETGKLLIITVPNGYGPRELLVTRMVIALEKKGAGKLVALVKKMLGYKGYTVQSSNPDLTHVQFFTRESLSSLISRFRYRNIEFRNGNFIEKVFPVSIIARRSEWLQKIDCRIADYLPSFMSSGFYTAWVKE